MALQTKERDNKIDNLRAVGTMLVILAHMSLLGVILNMRTFDVILLVMVSYMTFRMTNSGSTPYMNYVWKRIKRLVFPTYITLVVFFSLSDVLSLALQGTHVFELNVIISSFLFLDSGIPYIWIVRIFVVIAFFAPLISKFVVSLNTGSERIRLCIISILSVIIVSGGGQKLYDFFYVENSTVSSIINSWIVYPLIYIAITQLISIFIVLSKRYQMITSFVFCFAFVVLLIFHASFNPDDFKSPPQLFWVVYGMAISFLLYLYMPNTKCSFFEFISKNSLNIYLIHIILLMFYNKALSVLNTSSMVSTLLSLWVIRYFLIFGMSCFSILLWQRIVTHSMKKRNT